MQFKKIVLALAVAASLIGSTSAVGSPLTLPPTTTSGFCGWTAYGYYCAMGGTFSASNIQWADDLQWLGQVLVASSTAIQAQQQANVTAQGQQMTAQDNNIVATRKEQNAATCQQRIAVEYPNATLQLPNGTVMTPNIANVCASTSSPSVANQTGTTVAAVAVAASSFLDQSALTAANVSSLHNWDNGDHNVTKSAAINILANKDGESSLSALSNILEPNTTGILADENAGNYITIVNDPTPPPQLSTQVQNTVAGKVYLANKRIYGADMSLANAALFFVADNDVPTISIAAIKNMMVAETSSGAAAVTANNGSAAVTAATSSSPSQGASCGSSWNTGAGTQSHISLADANAIAAAHSLFPGVSRRMLAAINMHEGSGSDAACNGGACGGFGERATFVANICSSHYNATYPSNSSVCGGVMNTMHLIQPGNWSSGWAYNQGSNGQTDQIPVQQQANIAAANIQILQAEGAGNPAELAIGYGYSIAGMHASSLASYLTSSTTPSWIAAFMVYLTSFYHCPYALVPEYSLFGYGPSTIAAAVIDAAGGQDWPAAGQGASQPDLTVDPSSPDFIKYLLAISQNEGVAGYASVNTLLAAYAEGYFLSPKWYAQVVKNAGNTSFYNKTSAYMGGFAQEMSYLQNRVNQYKTALMAQMSALQVQQHFNGKLAALRARATTSQ